MAVLRGKNPAISWDSVREIFRKDDFEKLAGAKGVITVEEMERMLRDKTPRSRESLFAKLRQHADLLTTQFDLIQERHREAADELVRLDCQELSPRQSVACDGDLHGQLPAEHVG